MPQPSTNHRVFRKNKIQTFKTHLFSFQNTNQTNVVFFRTRPGKGLIWQKSSAT